VRLSIEPVTASLRVPFVSASGAAAARELLLVRLEATDGTTGFGEAAPLDYHDGVRLEDCRAALEDCRPILRNADDDAPIADILSACARVAVLGPAVAAVDLALWDLTGRRAGRPVWRCLGARPPQPLEINQTIAQPDRAGAAAAALAARRAGYATLKVKVGIGDDAGRLAAVRAAAGPGTRLRLDANGGWSLPEAEAALRALAAAGIELCEEPVAGLEQTAELARAVDTPLSIDESTALPGALEQRVCAAVCLKVGRSGGISGVIDKARRARAAGYEVYLASALDGPLGIAAALHAAAVVTPDRACGLATLEQFHGAPEALIPKRGRLLPPPGPGLGDGLEAWYRPH
jgi:L-alanine-DL-glutamate epimerase-like enolase superfamily enzyme